jgi:CheY-like chemotaxis protein
MRILILDDHKDHRAAFCKNSSAEIDLTFVETPEQAIGMLIKESWDAVLLEHDFNGVTFMDSGDPRSGYQAAVWLKQHPESMPPIVVLHSSNDGGRKNMHKLLPMALAVSHAWTFPLDLLGENRTDSRSTPLYYPVD